MADKKTLKVPVSLLKADPKNARTIEAPGLRGLGVSMETFGDLSGIVWNERTGHLVAGHQRMNRLRAAGAEDWVREGDRGVITHPKTGERFGIRIVDWDETTERMANLTANNPAIQGEFTEEAAEQLRALEDQVNFELLGLDELQLELDKEAGRAEADAATAGQEGEDDAPTAPQKPTTKVGDLWILGEHRLLCGNSTVRADVERLLGGEKPVLGLHDPPYGIGIQKSNGRIGDANPVGGVGSGGPRVAAKAYPAIAGDDRPFDPAHLLGSAVVVVLWGANHFADKLPASAAWIVWDKRVDMPSNVHGFSDAELAWCSKGGAVRTFRHLWSGLIRDGKTEDGPVRLHPTQKPIALYRWIVEQHTREGELVFDAYGGSGPTLLACEKLGRRARVMELAPAYCDVIVARWEALTGKKAVRQPAGAKAA